jgi:hypothetical protein
VSGKQEHPEPNPGGVVGALLALDELRYALATIRPRTPLHRPGEGPTANEILDDHLTLIAHALDAIERFVR